jgi:hypothetical protein
VLARQVADLSRVALVVDAEPADLSSPAVEIVTALTAGIAQAALVDSAVGIHESAATAVPASVLAAAVYTDMGMDAFGIAATLGALPCLGTIVAEQASLVEAEIAAEVATAGEHQRQAHGCKGPEPAVVQIWAPRHHGPLLVTGSRPR